MERESEGMKAGELEVEGLGVDEKLRAGGAGRWKEVLFLFEMMRKRLSGWRGLVISNLMRVRCRMDSPKPLFRPLRSPGAQRDPDRRFRSARLAQRPCRR